MLFKGEVRAEKNCSLRWTAVELNINETQPRAIARQNFWEIFDDTKTAIQMVLRGLFFDASMYMYQ